MTQITPSKRQSARSESTPLHHLGHRDNKYTGGGHSLGSMDQARHHGKGLNARWITAISESRLKTRYSLAAQLNKIRGESKAVYTVMSELEDRIKLGSRGRLVFPSSQKDAHRVCVNVLVRHNGKKFSVSFGTRGRVDLEAIGNYIKSRINASKDRRWTPRVYVSSYASKKVNISVQNNQNKKVPSQNAHTACGGNLCGAAKGNFVVCSTALAAASSLADAACGGAFSGVTGCVALLCGTAGTGIGACAANACGARLLGAGVCAGRACGAAGTTAVACALAACGGHVVYGGGYCVGNVCGGAARVGFGGCILAECGFRSTVMATCEPLACGADSRTLSTCAGQACAANLAVLGACVGNACVANFNLGPDWGPCLVNFLPFVPLV